MTLFAETFSLLRQAQTLRMTGRVDEVRGLSILVADLSLPIGSMVTVRTRLGEVRGEVIGFNERRTIVMLLGPTEGIQRGDRVSGCGMPSMAGVGEELLGRVVNALGQPIDAGEPFCDLVHRPLLPTPIDPLQRKTIDEPLGTGVRCVDAMLSVGRGQRLGIFSGPGVGKSTLLGMIAKHTDADVSVIALVGERGREVRDFIDQTLGPEGLRRSVVVTATGDEPALMRIRAAMYASSIAEYFRDEGLNVVLLMDSVTRFCQAQRQVGLAAGEPPATKGYPPSVFAQLPLLLERSGSTQTGSITGFYTILVEGDDLNEPVSDACRGILDGHVVLSRDLANRDHWPAIDVLRSVSRIARDVTDHDHQQARGRIMRLLSAWEQVEELVNINAYASGANPDFDLAIHMRKQIETLFQQTSAESIAFAQARAQLIDVANRAHQAAEQLKRRSGAPAQAAAPANG